MWMTDFVVGLLAISFIMLIYTLLWNSIVIRWNQSNKAQSLEESAIFASESLLATAGDPQSFERAGNINTSIRGIGLVNSRNELSRIKIEKLIADNSTYTIVKNRLGLSKYNFGFKIYDLQKNQIYYSYGQFSSGKLNDTVSFDRFAVLDNEAVIFHMEVFGG
jgi:hypothetical protein